MWPGQGEEKMPDACSLRIEACVLASNVGLSVRRVLVGRKTRGGRCFPCFK